MADDVEGAAVSPGIASSPWSGRRATLVILALNVGVFLAMCTFTSFDNFLRTSTATAIEWGASYGPDTLTGQPWRLLTSSFLHFGFFHLASNMLVLWLLGSQVERMYGTWRFVLIYLVSAVGAGCLSLLAVPTGAGAGASGAIYGLAGALLVFAITEPWPVVRVLLTRTGIGGLIYASISFVLGIGGGAQVANHLGGLFSGFLIGYFCRRDLRSRNRLEKMATWAWVVSLLVGLFVVVTYAPFDIKGNYKLALAVHELDQGRARAALAICEEFLARNPRSGSGILYRGLSRLALKEDEAALADINAAIKHGAELKAALGARMGAAFDLGYYRQVISDVSELLELGGDVNCIYMRAMACAQLHDFDEAFADARKLTRVFSRKTDGAILSAEIWRAQGRLKEALTEIGEALQADPDLKRALHLKVVLLAEQGSSEGGTSLQESLDLLGRLGRDRSQPRQFVYYAMIRLGLGDYEGAVKDADVLLAQEDAWQSGKATYPLIIKLLALQALHREDAQRSLALQVKKKLSEHCWPYPVLSYLLGWSSLSDLTGESNNLSRQTETDFYLAVSDFEGGRKTAAREKLDKLVEHGNLTYMEYEVGRLLRARLLKDSSGTGK